MTIRLGFADSPEQAIASGPIRKVVTGAARLAVDGGTACYVRESSDKPAPVADGSGFSMRLTPHAVLRTPAYGLKFSPIMGHAQLTREHVGLDMTTWNEAGAYIDGDNGNFARYILSRMSMNEVDVELMPEVDWEGRTLRPLVVRSATSGSSMTCLIDSDRGFMPLETHHASKKGVPFHSTYLTDIRKFSGERWFPMRCIVFHHAQEKAVVEIVVSEMNLDEMPPAEMFAVSLRDGTTINDGIDLAGQMRLTATTSVTPANIGALYDRLANVQEKIRAAKESEPTHGRVSRWLLATIATANLFLIGFFGWRWFHNSRSQRDAGSE